MTPLGWTGENEYPGNSSVALHINYGSLDVVNCDLENTAVPAWKYAGARTVRMLGGSLNLHNIIYEAESSFHIGTRAGSGAEASSVAIVWNGGLDDGLNGAVQGGWRMNFFDIDPRATGSLLIKDQVFSRGADYAGEQPASFLWRDRSDATDANPGTFAVVLDGVTLRDWSWFADSRGYFPPARGVEVELRDVTMSSYSMKGGGGPAGNEPVLQTQTRVRPGTRNLLAAVVDTTGSTLLHAQGSLARQGGWIPDIGCARHTAAFFSTNESLPMLSAGESETQVDGPAMRALRLQNGAECPLTLTSPRVPVESGRSYVLRGWIRTARSAPTASLNVTAEFFQWAPAALVASAKPSAAPTRRLMATATDDVGFDKAASAPRWEPLLLLVQAPADAGSALLRFELGAGATVDLFALALV